jgi:hypothetical protein
MCKVTDLASKGSNFNLLHLSVYCTDITQTETLP